MKIGAIVPQGWVGEYDGWDPTTAWRRTAAVAQQARAFGQLERHYGNFFETPTTKYGLRPEAIKDPQQIHELTAAFLRSRDPPPLHDVPEGFGALHDARDRRAEDTVTGDDHRSDRAMHRTCDCVQRVAACPFISAIR